MVKSRFELAALASMSAAVAGTFYATHRPGWVVAIIAALAIITAAGAVLARPGGRRG